MAPRTSALSPTMRRDVCVRGAVQHSCTATQQAAMACDCTGYRPAESVLDGAAATSPARPAAGTWGRTRPAAHTAGPWRARAEPAWSDEQRSQSALAEHHARGRHAIVCRSAGASRAAETARAVQLHRGPLRWLLRSLHHGPGQATGGRTHPRTGDLALLSRDRVVCGGISSVGFI